MKDKNGTELFNVEKNVAFPIFGCCYSNYFLPGYGLCCKYFCLPCFRFVWPFLTFRDLVTSNSILDVKRAMLKWNLFLETKNIILNTFQMYLDIRLSIFHPLNRQVLQATILQLFYPAVACFRTNATMLYMMWKVIFPEFIHRISKSIFRKINGRC